MILVLHYARRGCALNVYTSESNLTHAQLPGRAAGKERNVEMMKQAYLITAYKDYESLKNLVLLLTQTGLCFVHVDKKSKTITDDNIAALNRMEGCEAIREFDIKWGGFAHVRAVVKLMLMALSHEEISYLHLLTGEDFPLVPVGQLDEMFLGEMCDTIFMSYLTPDSLPETVTKRYQYRNFFQDRNVKNKLLWMLQDFTVQMQKILGLKRNGIGEFTDEQIYKGLVYISQPAEAARYVIDFISKHKSFWEALKSCQVPEEFFFQTIFMNSKEWKDRVINKELRYMDWSRGDGASPCYLTEADYEALMQAKENGCLFARKFHPQLSKSLRERIAKDLIMTMLL